MMDKELLSRAAALFRKEGRLIRLPPDRTIVFVGDTHGDREASEFVISRFLRPDHVIVFLGDYVDRGPDSPGNLELLLRTKVEYPERIYLLMGNHEAWTLEPFTPADFWRRLAPNAVQDYADALLSLPFAAYHPAGILALHGAFPDVERVEDIAGIELGSFDWRKITWGDWVDAPGYVVDPGAFGRPAFGRDYFEEMMGRLALKVLVRSHQPFAPLYLFEDRCLTIFTSLAYGGTERVVAVLRVGRALRSAKDLDLHYV